MEALIRECRIAYQYERAESADAPVVLLLHGWGCDGSIFNAWMSELCKHASVLVVDFPGHGKSGEPPMPWGVQEYTEQIVGLLDELAIEKVSIIAHSFGGRVAIWLSSHYPNRVSKMVITGGAGLRKPASETQTSRQKQYKRLKKMVEALRKVPFLQKVCDWMMEKLIQRYGSADYKRLNVNMRKTFVKVINEDLSPYLSDISASTLLVWGSNDTETPLWMGQKMEKEIPDAGLVVFEGRSHFAFVEEWQRFQVIVNTFFLGGNA